MQIDYARIFEECMGEKCLSYEVMSGSRTNTNAKVLAPSGTYAMRVPGEGTNEYIDRESEALNVRAVSKLSFVPEVAYVNSKTGVLVTRFLEGATGLTPADLSDPRACEGICGIFSELHFSDVKMANVFDIKENVKNYSGVLEREGVDLPIQVRENLPVLNAALNSLYEEYPLDLVPCHGDPNAANFMRRDDKYFLIDWEYSGMSERLCDLINIVLTDRLGEEQEELLLSTYERMSGFKISRRKYLLCKACIDYMWLYWHLIKLSQGSLVEYNDACWRNRLSRALTNIGLVEK